MKRPLKKAVPSPRARLRAALKLAKRAVERHEQKLADEGLTGHLRILRREYLTAARAKVRKLEAALKEEQTMRVDLADEEYQMVPPHPDWKLRAWRALRLSGKAYQRGEEVPINALGYNADNLLRGGHVRWQPPSTPKPKPPAPPPPPAAVVVPDLIEACRDALRGIMATGRSFEAALDLVDSRVYARAQKAYADAPHEAVDNAFGGGGRGRIKTGVGTSRRSVAGFDECLREGL